MSDLSRLGITTVASPLEVGADDAPVLLDSLQKAFGDTKSGRLELFRSREPVTDPASAVNAGRDFYDHRVDAVCILAASWFLGFPPMGFRPFPMK